MHIRIISGGITFICLFLYVCLLTWFCFHRENIGNVLLDEIARLENHHRSKKSTKVNLRNRRSKLTDLLTVPSNLDQKIKGIQKIHEFIYYTLDRLQNKGNCEDKKIIRCTYSGDGDFASIMEKYVICLHIAFALQRIYFIDYERKYSNLGWFTKLESTKCIHLKKELSYIRNKCYFNDSSCYITDSDVKINNSYKLLELTDYKNFPSPRYIPGTMPMKMEAALREIGVDNPPHWFTSQLYGYMLRPSEIFKKRFDKLINVVDLGKKAIGVAIKGADSRIMDEQYYSKVALILQNTSKANNLYLASNDENIIHRFEKYTNGRFNVKRTPSNRLRTIIRYHDNNDVESFKALIDLYLLLLCDRVVISSRSNFGKLVLALKRSIYPFDVNETVVPILSKLSYEMTALFYRVTIGENGKEKKIKKDTILAYKRGRLYMRISDKSLREKGEVKSQVYSYVYVPKSHPKIFG